ncbi:MAG: hypothetical protein JNG88_01855 [Phycisphaerales bacterium]|nr:hypothetical protein [Phycisphaerales bacterium]
MALRKLLTILPVLVLVSCASRRGRDCEYEASVIRAERPRCANLALGPTREDAVFAEAFAGRLNWPSYDRGYLLDSTTYVTQFQYDDQSFYDRLGGGFMDSTESVRNEIWVR